MGTFFFQLKKCFVLKAEIEYDIKNFIYSSQDDSLLRVFFNRTFVDRHPKVYFINMNQNSYEFSKLIPFKFLEENSRKSYLLRQQYLEVTYDDHFNLIKNPMSLFADENRLNDVSRYIDKMKTNFKTKFNRHTLQLPLLRDDFDSQLDDDLFEQYYLQVQNVTDHCKPINLNYRRAYVINHISGFDFHTRTGHRFAEFNFIPIFFKICLEVLNPNKNNYSTLCINLLNSFSLFLNLSIFDLYDHLYNHICKLKSILHSFYHFLLSLSGFLVRKIKNEL